MTLSTYHACWRLFLLPARSTILLTTSTVCIQNTEKHHFFPHTIADGAHFGHILRRAFITSKSSSLRRVFNVQYGSTSTTALFTKLFSCFTFHTKHIKHFRFFNHDMTWNSSVRVLPSIHNCGIEAISVAIGQGNQMCAFCTIVYYSQLIRHWWQRALWWWCLFIATRCDIRNACASLLTFVFSFSDAMRAQDWHWPVSNVELVRAQFECTSAVLR